MQEPVPRNAEAGSHLHLVGALGMIRTCKLLLRREPGIVILRAGWSAHVTSC